MEYSITLKTDASFKEDVGTGVSYIAHIENGEGERRSVKNSDFIEEVNNSTEAETLAVVYAVAELLQKTQEKNECNITVQTDCQYTARKLEERYPEQPEIVKLALNLLDVFGEWNVQWISRSTNKKADALARSQLMNYEDGYD